MEVLDAEMSDDAKGGDGRRETGRALGVEDGREVAHFPVGYSSLIDAYAPRPLKILSPPSSAC